MTSDLKKMRADQEKMMVETVYVQSRTRTSDNAGGYTEVFNTVATVKGRIASASQTGNEGIIGGKVTPQAEYIVTLPWNTVVNESNRLQISGTQYEVVEVKECSEKTALRVLCNKIG
jgi:head-tail adaptor